MQRRPCWVEISTESLEYNYQTLVAACDQSAASLPTERHVQNDQEARVEVLAIVKADAYGHGLELCAPAVLRAGARWVGVTSVEEGVAARLHGIEAGFGEAEILVIGGPFAGQGAAAIEHRLTTVVWEQWQLDELEAAGRAAGCEGNSIAVHLELDTGMSRQGAGEEGLGWILERLAKADTPLRLDGVMTHLYAADESDGAATREQFALLERMVERVRAAGLRPKWLHVGNSAAVLWGEVAKDLRTLANRWGMRAMVRPGLALYGLAPEIVDSEGQPQPCGVSGQQLRRVLAWKTRVVSVRSIAAGQVVGYNGSFVATEPMRIALLAVGYADGLKRSISGRGYVLVGGERAPIIGRISMDQTVVDVTEIPDGKAGDEVVLLGSQGAESIYAEDHAEWTGTIPWEIFTSIAGRVPRQPSGEVSALLDLG